jgi:hypothetical protein
VVSPLWTQFALSKLGLLCSFIFFRINRYTVKQTLQRAWLSGDKVFFQINGLPAEHLVLADRVELNYLVVGF